MNCFEESVRIGKLRRFTRKSKGDHDACDSRLLARHRPVDGRPPCRLKKGHWSRGMVTGRVGCQAGTVAPSITPTIASSSRSHSLCELTTGAALASPVSFSIVEVVFKRASSRVEPVRLRAEHDKE